MQPFCSITSGLVGGSKRRSPRPSATKTITFWSSPFAPAITSCVTAGDECCLAQLGSAAMLMSFGFGTLPSTRTMPFSAAAPELLVAGGEPALTSEDVLSPMIRDRKRIEIFFFNLLDFFLLRF